MKFINLLLFSFLTIGATAQVVNIPDTEFKAILVGNLSINTNSDTEIQVSEAQAYTGSINCNTSSVTDITGIEEFTNLSSLTCTFNAITSADLSQNTELVYFSFGYNNVMTSLTLGQHNNLETIYCQGNLLTSLDVSQCPNLENLYCNGNDLTELNVSQNPNLIELNCAGNNLSELDLSQNLNLVDLQLYSNSISALDLSQHTNLELLECSGNLISELDVSQNGNLIGLYCGFNPISSIDVSSNTQLEELLISRSSINTVDLSQNPLLTYLSFYETNISNIDLSQNTLLERVYCYETPLVELNLDQNTMLERLECYDTKISSLDLTNNDSLEIVECNQTNLACLNVANGFNADLSLEAHDNPYLSCIQVDNNFTPTTWLKDPEASWSFDCQFPNLFASTDTVDFGLVTTGSSVIKTIIIENRGCTDLILSNLNFSGNTSSFSHDAPNTFTLETGDVLEVNVTFNSSNTSFQEAILSYDHNDGGGLLEIVIEAQGSTDCLIFIPDDNFKNYLVENNAINTNNDGEIQCSEATDFNGNLNCSYNEISDLSGVEHFVNIDELNCRGNMLTELDVSENVNIIELRCSYNNLSSLTIGTNDSLQQIIATHNELTFVDVTQVSSLISLNVRDNMLTQLDLSGNLNLIDLFCYNNKLTNLDVSFLAELVHVRCYDNLLQTLNLANGNNANFVNALADDNPYLMCIQVDGGFDPDALSNWTKDSGAEWNVDCGCMISSSTDNQFSCGDFTWINGQTYSESTIDSYTTTNVDGCDSIITLNLTIADPIIVTISESNGTLNASGGDSYAWYFNGTIIPNENSNSLSLGAFGNYYAVGTNTENCTGVSNTYTHNDAKINENDLKQNISIYPNPTNGLISVKSDIAIQNIEVINNIGQTVDEFNSTQLDLTHLNKGVYFVKVKTELGTKTERLFKL